MLWNIRIRLANLTQQLSRCSWPNCNSVEWRPSHQTWSIRNSSDLRIAGRIDAEYFQLKYEEIIKAIKGFSGGWDTLGNLVTMRRCIEVGSKEYLDEGIPFVRVSNLSPFDITEEKYISEELYETILDYQPEAGRDSVQQGCRPRHCALPE